MTLAEVKQYTTPAGVPGEVIEHVRGAKYDSELSITDIAKRVRADIKDLKSKNQLPKDLKVSVKCDKYSMGCTLHVLVVATSEVVVNVDAYRKQEAADYNLSWADCGGRLSAKGRQILERLDHVVKQYQRAETHHQSDYCNVRFHEDTDIDGQLLRQQFEASNG